MKKFLFPLIAMILLITGLIAIGNSAKEFYKVDSEKCIGCQICVQKCPVNAISMVDGKAVIDPEKCINCGLCEKVCPVDAISKQTIEEKKETSETQKENESNIKSIEDKSSSKSKKVVADSSVSKVEKKVPTKKVDVKAKLKKVYEVIKEKCIGCQICVSKCPVNAIEMIDGKAVIDAEKCIGCGICAGVCPVKAIKDTLIAEPKKTSMLPTKLIFAKTEQSKVKETKNIEKKKTSFIVETFKCVGCGDCDSVCPVNAIDVIDGKAIIDTDKCINCGLCQNNCTYDAIRKGK